MAYGYVPEPRVVGVKCWLRPWGTLAAGTTETVVDYSGHGRHLNLCFEGDHKNLRIEIWADAYSLEYWSFDDLRWKGLEKVPGVGYLVKYNPDYPYFVAVFTLRFAFKTSLKIAVTNPETTDQNFGLREYVELFKV